jgi:hypothetical protein
MALRVARGLPPLLLALPSLSGFLDLSQAFDGPLL